MQPSKRRTLVEETITGAIGILMVTVFLGFLAVDIGSIPLLIITALVLAMVLTDFVQTVRDLRRSDNQNTGE